MLMPRDAFSKETPNLSTKRFWMFVFIPTSSPTIKKIANTILKTKGSLSNLIELEKEALTIDSLSSIEVRPRPIPVRIEMIP